MNKGLDSIELLGYNVYSKELNSIDFLGQKKFIINTINPHSYCEAEKDAAFKASLINSNVIIPDGIGIVLAARLLNGVRLKKIAGADLHISLLEKMNEIGGKVFYLGSSLRTLGLIKNRVNLEFPNVKVYTYSPPYKAQFSDNDNTEMRDAVNQVKPDILFVGMTAPKQEKWSDSNIEFLDVGTITSIGAVFDFYAGTVKRSGKLWIKLGLEWLPRLIREPKRLWRRNFVSTPKFIGYIFKEKIKMFFNK